MEHMVGTKKSGQSKTPYLQGISMISNRIFPQKAAKTAIKARKNRSVCPLNFLFRRSMKNKGFLSRFIIFKIDD